MNVKNNLLLTLITLFFGIAAFSQTNQPKEKWVNEIGIGLPITAVADDVLLGLEIVVLKDLFHWKNGAVSAGLSVYAGTSIVAVNDVNEYLSNSTNFLQPLQLIVGHQLDFFEKRMFLKTNFHTGWSRLAQKVKLEDDRFALSENYQYRRSFFTIHTNIGLGIALGKKKKNSLLLYSTLGIVNPRIAPWSLGIGFNRKL